MDRLFLDANILIAALWRPQSLSGRLLMVPGITRITSEYAVREARLSVPASARTRLEDVLTSVTVVADPSGAAMPDGVTLPSKDQPILLAAIHAGATHLITSDKQHFGPYYGQTVSGVTILRPASYAILRRRGS